EPFRRPNNMRGPLRLRVSSICTGESRLDIPGGPPRTGSEAQWQHHCRSGGHVHAFSLVWLLLWLAAQASPAPDDSSAGRATAVNRFLARVEPVLTHAVALRHLVATTRGGTMRGWMDACTVLDNGQLSYWIVAEGGSGTVRKRALVAALDGEVKARKEPVSRAALDPSNYEFAPEVAEDGLLRIGLTPRRKDTMLI